MLYIGGGLDITIPLIRVIHNGNIAKAILPCFFLLKIFTPWVVPASLGRTAGEMIYLSVIHKGNIG